MQSDKTLFTQEASARKIDAQQTAVALAAGLDGISDNIGKTFDTTVEEVDGAITELALDVMQEGVSLVTIVTPPQATVVLNVINAGVYALRGKYVDATLNLAFALLPGGGKAAGVAKATEQRVLGAAERNAAKAFLKEGGHQAEGNIFAKAAAELEERAGSRVLGHTAGSGGASSSKNALQ